MLSKEEFCEAIKSIKAHSEALSDLNNVSPSLATAITEDYSLQDPMIKVLDAAMNLPVHPQIGSTISWWVYDTHFGKSDPFIWLDKDRPNEEKVVLDTPEKLYDWCYTEGIENE